MGLYSLAVVNLSIGSAIGHDLTLTMLASDCGAGGHGGYAYLDGFGAAPPPPGPVPDPPPCSSSVPAWPDWSDLAGEGTGSNLCKHCSVDKPGLSGQLFMAA